MMIKYEYEITLQLPNLKNKDEFISFLDAQNLLSELNFETPNYMYVASETNEDNSLDVLFVLLDWLEDKNIEYTLREFIHKLNYEGDITYTVLKNMRERDKQIDDDMDYELESEDDYWD